MVQRASAITEVDCLSKTDEISPVENYRASSLRVSSAVELCCVNIVLSSTCMASLSDCDLVIVLEIFSIFKLFVHRP